MKERTVSMNKKISTRSGFLTGLSILLYLLILHRFGVHEKSPLTLLQFAILFAGVLVSSALLYKHYAGITFFESFNHNAKTVATSVVLLIIGQIMMYLIFAKGAISGKEITFLMMKSIFAYSLSGLLSSLFCSYIFYTFTKK